MAKPKRIQPTDMLGRYNLCAECPEPGRYCACDDERGIRNIDAIRQHATALLSMGDMLAYARDARNMHYWPIDTAKFPKTGVDWTTGRTLRVGHAPAHFKGTRYLIDAIEHLKAQGCAIELVSITGVPNSEVIALFRSCDLVADQFIAGFHGYTALEAMALGKPVLCYEHHYSLEAVAIRLGKLYLETAAFPDRINRMIAQRVSRLEARLPPLLPGMPPVPWELAEETDQRLWLAAEAAAR